MSIGAAIRAAREKRGLSQVKLAALVGIQFETMSRWERGALNPTQRSLMALDSVLGSKLAQDQSKPRRRTSRKRA